MTASTAGDGFAFADDGDPGAGGANARAQARLRYRKGTPGGPGGPGPALPPATPAQARLRGALGQGLSRLGTPATATPATATPATATPAGGLLTPVHPPPSAGQPPPSMAKALFRADQAAPAAPAMPVREPPGLLVCKELVLGFQRELRERLAVKLTCLEGTRKSFAGRGEDPRRLTEVANAFVEEFPRATCASYQRRVAHLSSYGVQCPDALALALLAWMPETSGLEREISQEGPENYADPWCAELRQEVGFARFLGSLEAYGNTQNPIGRQLVEITVEIAVADVLHALLVNAPDIDPAVAERVQRRTMAVFIKHPAWIPTKVGALPPGAKAMIYHRGSKGLPGRGSKEGFVPKVCLFGKMRAAVYDQWAAVLGVLSGTYLKPILESVLRVVRMANEDALGMVILSGCRYLRWSTHSAVEVLALRQFLRFNISIIDTFRRMEERLLHIDLFDCIIQHTDFTVLQVNQEKFNLWQHEVSEIYTMAVRWSQRDGLQSSACLLLASIFARCPGSVLPKAQPFLHKRLFPMLQHEGRALTACTCLARLLTGAYVPGVWGWFPKRLSRGGGGNVVGGEFAAEPFHPELWRPYVEDEGRVFACVAREEDSPEDRHARVLQIWEMILAPGKQGLRMTAGLVEVVTRLVMHSAVNYFDYVAKSLLPAMLHCEKEANDLEGWLWNIVGITSFRAMLDPASGFATYAPKSRAFAGRGLTEEALRKELREVGDALSEALGVIATNTTTLLQTAAGGAGAEPMRVPPHIFSPYKEAQSILEDTDNVGFEIMLAAQHSEKARGMLVDIQSLLTQADARPSALPSLAIPQEDVDGVFAHDTATLFNVWRLEMLDPPLSRFHTSSHRGVPIAQNPASRSPPVLLALVQELNYVFPFLDVIAATGASPNHEGFMGGLLLHENEVLRQAASASLQALAYENPHHIPDLLLAVCDLLASVDFKCPGDQMYLLANVSLVLETWYFYLVNTPAAAPFMLEDAGLVRAEAHALVPLCSGNQAVRNMALHMLKWSERTLALQRSLGGSAGGQTPLSTLLRYNGAELISRGMFRLFLDRSQDTGVVATKEVLVAMKIHGFDVYQLAGGACARQDCWLRRPSDRWEAGPVAENETELYTNVLIEATLMFAENLNNADAVHGIHRSLSKVVASWSDLDAGTNRFKGEEGTLVNVFAVYMALQVCAVAGAPADPAEPSPAAAVAVSGEPLKAPRRSPVFKFGGADGTAALPRVQPLTDVEAERAVQIWQSRFGANGKPRAAAGRPAEQLAGPARHLAPGADELVPGGGADLRARRGLQLGAAEHAGRRRPVPAPERDRAGLPGDLLQGALRVPLVVHRHRA